MFIETATNIVKKIKLYFDQDTEVFCKEYRESISLEEIKESWNYCIDNSIIPKACRGILLDYRAASFDMSTQEIYDLVEFYDQQVSKLKQSRIAILTERPDQIVIPSLLMQKAKKPNIQVFTSLNASLNWARFK